MKKSLSILFMVAIKHLIKTNPRTGLVATDAVKAIETLNQ